MKKPISFCITASSNEKYYVIGLLDSLVANTEFDRHEVLILIDSDNQNQYEEFLEYRKDKPNIKIYKNESHRLGYQRNISILFSHATNDIVVYLQADMVAGNKLDHYFLEALGENKKAVISLARIEPPIHPESEEKITKSFGLTPEEFQYDDFMKFSKELQKENRPMIWSHFAPFGMYKETYFKSLGGFDTRFRCSREDSDFIIRIGASGLEALETWNAHVYHYTCVSSRGKDWFKQNDEDIRIKNEWQSTADQEELRRFIRKWGFFGHHYLPKFDSALVIDIDSVPHFPILEAIEPYFGKIVINDKPVLNSLMDKVDFNYYYYANHRWNYDNEKWGELKSRFNESDKLKDRFSLLSEYKSDNDIIVTTKMSELIKSFNIPATNQFIKQSNEIFSNLLIGGNNPQGKYNIGCFDIKIKQLVDINKKHIEGSQYVFDTSEFIFE
tara:strand:- start:1263 stop:2591 length:1329 start_codon:yes stop_codon:yes gene_type:complete